MEVQEETPLVLKLSLPDLTTIDKSSQGWVLKVDNSVDNWQIVQHKLLLGYLICVKVAEYYDAGGLPLKWNDICRRYKPTYHEVYTHEMVLSLFIYTTFPLLINIIRIMPKGVCF